MLFMAGMRCVAPCGELSVLRSIPPERGSLALFLFAQMRATRAGASPANQGGDKPGPYPVRKERVILLRYHRRRRWRV